jgi:hypothetical protein
MNSESEILCEHPYVFTKMVYAPGRLGLSTSVLDYIDTLLLKIDFTIGSFILFGQSLLTLQLSHFLLDLIVSLPRSTLSRYLRPPQVLDVFDLVHLFEFS